MPRIVNHVNFIAKPECADQLVEMFKTSLPDILKEKGVEHYVVTRSVSAPTHFKIFEVYSSQEALDGHMNGEYLKLKSYMEKHEPLTGPPSIEQHTLVEV